MPLEGVPAIRREADLQLGDRGRQELSLLEVGAGLFGFRPAQEDLVKEFGRRLVGREERFTLGRAGLSGIGDGDPRAAREELDGIHELDVFAQHHELEEVPAGLAPEAVEESLGVVEVEGGSFLGMEWAEASELAAHSLESDRLAQQCHDVDRGTDSVDEIRSDRACQGPPYGPPVASHPTAPDRPDLTAGLAYSG